MRYSKDHKAETHARIVRHASAQLREKGTRGVGVADLMKEAGLTHGGFYAHFGSREDLVIEAIAYAMDQTTERWGKLFQDTAVTDRLAMLTDSYLTTHHRDHPEKGCAIPALAGDIARESPKTRRVFLNKLEHMISLFAGEASDPASAEARQKAIGTIATLMGSVVLARVAGNGAFSQEVLDAGRAMALGKSAAGKKAVGKTALGKTALGKSAPGKPVKTATPGKKPAARARSARAGHA